MCSSKLRNLENLDLFQVKDCQLPTAAWPSKGYTWLVVLHPSGPSVGGLKLKTSRKTMFFLQYSFRPRRGRISRRVLCWCKVVRPPPAWGRSPSDIFPYSCSYWPCTMLHCPVHIDLLLIITSVRSSLRNHKRSAPYIPKKCKELVENCVNGDDTILQQEYVIREIYGKMV